MRYTVYLCTIKVKSEGDLNLKFITRIPNNDYVEKELIRLHVDC